MISSEKAIGESEICVPLTAVGRGDVAAAGGKAANLGEMLYAGIPVPPGFVITTAAFREFMDGHGLTEVVADLIAGVDVHDSTELSRVASEVRGMILSKPVSPTMAAEVIDACGRLGNCLVAVRSSATAEDLEDASFAGQQSTFLNVGGADNVLSAVRAAWASLYEARAIFYREENGIRHSDVSIALVVQQMVPADVSGVMFTMDPSADDHIGLLIEALYGLGEPLVSGELSPDAYVVDRLGLRLSSRDLVVQPWMLCQNGAEGFENGSKRVPVPRDLQGRQKLDDARITALAELGVRLERYFGRPQDVEWAMADGTLYIVQSRPITASAGPQSSMGGRNGAMRAIVSGAGASPGVVAGPTRIIHDPADIKWVMDGDILVTEMTTPDFVPAMKRAAAIVTDRGGRTCHAAIVSREMGLPCVVGAGDATTALRDVPLVTVDGRAGTVFEGDVEEQLRPKDEPIITAVGAPTRTKLYVNLADPDAARAVSALDVDGVGLLRAEFMIAHLGEHPRAMLESGRGAEFTDHLAQGLEDFASAFAPRPVVYRFSDFKTNEYRNLKGGEAWEPHEENPMIGYRGGARYLAEPDVFALEVQALKRVRQRFSNLWAMVPFVRSVPELRAVMSLLRQEGLDSESGFKLWMMAELPSNVLLLDQFLDAGVDGVSIGSNDLTQLILGLDRDSERLAPMFDERDPAVLQAIEHVVRRCSARGVSVSICGQAPSVYPEFTRKLVEWGITSVSVSPDMIAQTRSTLQQAEHQAVTSEPQLAAVR